MCVQSIKVPIRKESGNLFNEPRIIDYLSTSEIAQFTSFSKFFYEILEAYIVE